MAFYKVNQLRKVEYACNHREPSSPISEGGFIEYGAFWGDKGVILFLCTWCKIGGIYL